MKLSARRILSAMVAGGILDRDDGRTYNGIDEAAEWAADVEAARKKRLDSYTGQSRHQRRAEAAIARRRGAK